MKSRSVVLITLFLFSTLNACSIGSGDDDFSLVGTELSVADIAGNWTATMAFFSRNGEGPVQEVDVVAEGGSATLQIQSNGRFSLTLTRAGESPEISTGRLGFDEELLVVSFDDDPEEFDFFRVTLDEPVLSISGGDTVVTFDFDGDGVDESASIEFDFVRS